MHLLVSELHTLTLLNAFFFSNATLVARTHLNVNVMRTLSVLLWHDLTANKLSRLMF